MKKYPRKTIYFTSYLAIKTLHFLLTEKAYQYLRLIAHTKFPKVINKIRDPDLVKYESTVGAEILTLEYPPVHDRKFPSISIVVATLGERDSLFSALESVKCDSSGLDLELVIVAPAEAHEKIRIMLKKLLLENYTLIEDRKLGIYQAMNIGILHSNKDFVIFLNDDDKIIPNAITSAFKLIKRKDYPDLIACNSLYHYSCCNYYNLTRAEKALGRGVLHGAMSTSHQSQIWNRNVLVELNGFQLEIRRTSKRKKVFKLKLASDFEFFVRALSKNISYEQIDINMSISSPKGAAITLWRKTYIELLWVVWYIHKPGFKWLLKLPFLIFSIETYHRNSGWFHEH
jgi:glycosyltransferase involved in cell wall biosynthesis